MRAPLPATLFGEVGRASGLTCTHPRTCPHTCRAHPLTPPAAGARLITLVGAEEAVPSHLEVVHLPYERGAAYPGIFLFTQAARMARPVRQTASGAAELLGSLEQHNMAIRCPDGGPRAALHARGWVGGGGWGGRWGGWVGGWAGGWVGGAGAWVRRRAEPTPPPPLPRDPLPHPHPNPPRSQSSTPAPCCQWWLHSPPTLTSTSRLATCTSARWASRRWALPARWVCVRVCARARVCVW